MLRYCRFAVYAVVLASVFVAGPGRVFAIEPSQAQIDEAKRRIDQDPEAAKRELESNPLLMSKLSPGQRDEVMQYINAAEQRAAAEHKASANAEASPKGSSSTPEQKQAVTIVQPPTAQAAPGADSSVPTVAPAPPSTTPVTVAPAPPQPVVVTPPAEKKEEEGVRDVYGRNVFREEFLNPQYIEIPDDYVIAPGDEILLRFWGSFNQERKYLIGDDGYVFIEPLKRQAYLIGMTFGGLRAMVQRVSTASPGVEGDVRIVNAHPIYAHVAGNALHPGTVSAPAYYTLWQFLMLSKGPSDNGSVRDIRVSRKGREIAKIDIYDFLRSGRKPVITIQNEDLVFFGEAGRIVSIEHFVKKPGLYELKETERLGELVAIAGGFASGIFAPRIQIQRTVDISEKSSSGYPYTVIDVDLTRKGWEKIELKDGDKVLARNMAPLFANDIYIIGKGIAVPGRYSLPRQAWSAADLVREAGGLVPGAHRTGDLLRLNPDRKTRSFIPLDLSDASALQAVTLMPLDSIITYHDSDFVDRGTIKTDGHVRRPIEVRYADSLTIADALRASEGLQPGAYRYADLLRLNPDRKTHTSFVVDLFDTAGLKKTRLMPYDCLVAYSQAQFVDVTMVKTRGFVRKPIEIQYSDSLTLADVLRKSEGLREGALPYTWVKKTDDFGRVSYQRFDISDSAANAGTKISRRDDVMFFDYRAFNEKLPVTVLAYDKEPLVLQYSPDLTLETIIHELGGISPLIDSSRVEICVPDFRDEITYATVNVCSLNVKTAARRGMVPEGSIVFLRKDEKKNFGYSVTIDGEVRRPGQYPLLRRDTRLSEIFDLAGGLTERANKWGISITREGKAGGIPVEVENSSGLEFVSDWVMDKNDRIHVARNDYTVEIAGAVFDPRIAAFHPGYSWKDYVKKSAGGPLDTADMSKTYVQYPNGITKKARSGWCIFSSNADVRPGCRVVVPLKPYVAPEPPAPLGSEKNDYTKIISVTASALMSILAVIVIMHEVNK